MVSRIEFGSDHQLDNRSRNRWIGPFRLNSNANWRKPEEKEEEHSSMEEHGEARANHPIPGVRVNVILPRLAFLSCFFGGVSTHRRHIHRRTYSSGHY